MTPNSSARSLGLGIFLLFLLCTVGDAAAVSVRVRLAEPALEAAPGGRAGLTSELGADHRVTSRLSVPPALREFLARRSREHAAARSLPSSGGEDLLRELSRWVRMEIPGDRIEEVLASLARDPRVDVVEPVEIAETASLDADDPLVPNQGGSIGLIGVIDAWQAASAPSSRRIRVAVVDGGTDWNHPDLLANVARNDVDLPGDGLDQDGNGFVDDHIGWNFALESTDPSPLPSQPASGAHGTHVAGTIGAILGNATGVAGIGGNPELILVNAAHPEVDGGIGWGYEGILYAMSRGADLINCSWRAARFTAGRLLDASYNDFNALVVRYARQSGALVLAATGNEGRQDLWTTPAGYADVFAVAASSYGEETLYSSSNLGPWVDLVAPGQLVLSTLPRSEQTQLGPYGFRSGTSMATAVATGVAALVWSQHADWDVEQLASRLRWTAKEAEGLGPYRLVRADLALAPGDAPDVAVDLVGVVDADGDGLVEGDETIELVVTMRSMFERQFGVKIEAWTDDPWLVPLTDALILPSLPHDDELRSDKGLKFWVHPNAPVGHRAWIHLRASAGGISGPRRSGAIELRPLSVAAANERLRTRLSANGVLGEPLQIVSRRQPVPALGREAPESGALRQAALLLGTPDGQVTDALLPRAPLRPFKDFVPAQEGISQEVDADGWRKLKVRLTDGSAPVPRGISLTQEAWMKVEGEDQDFLLACWTVTAAGQSLEDLRWGLALDWRVPETGSPLSVEGTVGRSPAGLRVAAAGTSSPVAGLDVLEGGEELGLWPLARWAEEDRPGWNLPADGAATVPEDALAERMRAGAAEELPGTGDAIFLLSGRLGSLERGESRRFTVAVAIGDDATTVDRALERARLAWEAASIGEQRQDLGTSIVSFSSNPFRESTELRLYLAEPGPVKVDVFDLRGRRVRTLVDGERRAGVHRVGWDGRDQRGAGVASGVYLVRLETREGVRSAAITRVR